MGVCSGEAVLGVSLLINLPYYILENNASPGKILSVIDKNKRSFDFLVKLFRFLTSASMCFFHYFSAEILKNIDFNIFEE